MKPLLPSAVVRSLEQFALEGPIGTSAAILIGLALSAVFAWVLRREIPTVGTRVALAFWALRTTAVALVIWMLLAPTAVRIETATTPKAIIVATDVSGSMQTVDPPGTADDLRWIADSSAASANLVDRAMVALVVSERQLQLAVETLRGQRRESAAIESILRADDALARCRNHLQQIQKSSSERSAELSQRLLTRLDSAEFQAFAQLRRALQRGRSPQEKSWQESLPDLVHRMAGLRPSLMELARIVAESDHERIAREVPETLQSVHTASRGGRVAAWLTANTPSIEALTDQVDVRRGTFDRTLRWIAGESEWNASPTMNVDGTDLSAVFDSVQREQQQRKVAAVFLLSDFAHNAAVGKGPVEAVAALSGVPVYCVPIGNPQHVRDVQLQSVFAPPVAMRNDDIVIEAHVQAYDCAGEVCVVQLLQDGQPIGSREVVVDSAYVSRTVRFEQHVPAIGTESFQVAVVPLDAEATEENNSREFEVNVTRSEIKILLADELPRWEYRYLTQLFRRDPKVECDELLYRPRLIATGRREATQGFPTTVEEWDQYDVVLLGDLPPERMTVPVQESLAEYVQQRGGTVVLIAGRLAMPQAFARQPLEELLPVRSVESASAAEGFTLAVTQEGRGHPALLIGESDEANRTAWDFVQRSAQLGEVSNWRQPLVSAHNLIAAVPKTSGNEAAEEQKSTYLCWQAVGRGRVVYLSAPESFRLRFLRGDRLHHRFWGQLLRWAIASELSAGSKFVRLRTDKSRYQPHETVHVAVRLTDHEGQPVLTDGLTARVTQNEIERTVRLVATPQNPAEYTAELHGLSPGTYQIEPAGPAIDELRHGQETAAVTARFTVQPDSTGERIDTRCDRALAQQIAEATGGQVIPPAAISEILLLTNLEPEVSEKIERQPLWVRWKYLWLVFGCLHTEWIIRKWLGLS